LPRASTAATLLPTTPSADARASTPGTADLNRVTARPTSTPASVAALVAIVSPSGTPSDS
jgi:hypothetical protein